MAEETYDLQVLLELRERARDEAQDEVALQVSELARAQQIVRDTEQKLRDAITRREQLAAEYDRRATQGDLIAGQLYNVTNYLRGLRADEQQIVEEIEGAKKDVITQQQRVDAARQSLMEAATELEAVLSHHQQWSDEQRVLAERKQSSAMDDIAARLWRENQS